MPLEDPPMGIMGLHCKVWQVWGSGYFVFSDFGFEFSDFWFRASGFMLGAFSWIRSHCERQGEKRCYLPCRSLAICLELDAYLIQGKTESALQTLNPKALNQQSPHTLSPKPQKLCTRISKAVLTFAWLCGRRARLLKLRIGFKV